MRNRQKEENQRLKGYLLRNGRWHAFWFRETYDKTINTAIGQPFADSSRRLITESPLSFRVNDKIKIRGEESLVERIEYEIKSNPNSLRGNPSYIKTLEIS